MQRIWQKSTTSVNQESLEKPSDSDSSNYLLSMQFT
jgi:hypothetical protein